MVDDVVGIYSIGQLNIVEVLAMMGGAWQITPHCNALQLLQYTPTPVGKQGTRINTIDRALQTSPVKKGHRIG